MFAPLGDNLVHAFLPNVKDEPRRANYHGISPAGKAIESPPVAALALATCSASFSSWDVPRVDFPERATAVCPIDEEVMILSFYRIDSRASIGDRLAIFMTE